MTVETRNDNRDWPNRLNVAWNMNENEVGSVFINPKDAERQRLCVYTLEGVMDIGWGDWIIQGVKRELYPCKDAIFGLTYEPVVD